MSEFSDAYSGELQPGKVDSPAPRQQSEGDEYRPQVPPGVRDVAYFIGLGVAFVAFVVAGVASVWFGELEGARVAATVGLISSGYSIISNGLGVVYRPGGGR